MLTQKRVLSIFAVLTSQILLSDGFQLATTTRDAPSRLFLAPQQLGSFETLDATTTSEAARRVVLEDLVSVNSERVDFEEAWDWQKFLLQQHVERLTEDETSQFLSEDQAKDIQPSGSFAKGGLDTIFMLEHNAVYTLGTGSDEKFITGTNPDVPVVRMDRGGEVTYHGPGQLVVYPVLDLRVYKQDIHWYMRALEESVLLALQKVGVDAVRQDDTTGIWVDNHKVAAIGVKCRRWITMHGLAVNIEDTSMANFGGIVPCGLEGRKVGHVNQFLKGREPLTVAEFSKYMKEALEEVFQIELQSRPRANLPEL